mmetsp:Transcript_103789/g.293780  ORF Transcript_103789/g.293780 Transcript_103789/m.293780 type:complete len:286 (+) Transcript_103789:337-1194(+)
MRGGAHHLQGGAGTQTCKGCDSSSVVVVVQHGLVRRERIKPLLHEALRLVDQRAHLGHLVFNLVAEVLGLCDHVVRSLLHHLRQLLRLGLHRGVQRLAVARQVGRVLVQGQVLGKGWDECSVDHVDHGACLDVEGRVVGLVHHLGPRLGLLLGKDAQSLEELDVLVRCPVLDGLRRRVEIGEATLLRLDRPLGRIAVAGEDDVAVHLVHLGHGVARLCAALDLLGERAHARGHDRVADHHRERAVLRGAHRAELVAVAAEGEGRGAIAVLDVGLHGHGRLAAGGL